MSSEMTWTRPVIDPGGAVEPAAAETAARRRRESRSVAHEGMRDAELARLACDGDRGAGDLLARRYRRPAYLLALQLMRDPDDALDVAQDALLRFFTHLDRLEEGREVRPWLYAIVRNRAHDVMRRRKLRRTEPLAGTDPDLPPIELADDSPGPGAVAERRELQRRMWQALSGLSEPQREILVLRDYHDLSYQEIARVLHVPIGTVMSRLHRARHALKDLLTGAAWADPDRGNPDA